MIPLFCYNVPVLADLPNALFNADGFSLSFYWCHVTLTLYSRRGGSRGRVQGVRTPPPGMTCGRFLINTVQSLDRHTKSALPFDMYSQQFTLCYFLVKSLLLRIRS